MVYVLLEVKREINDLKEVSLFCGKMFYFWLLMFYVKILFVVVFWWDKYMEVMFVYGYEEGVIRSWKEYFVLVKVSFGFVILIIIFINLFIFLM